MGDTLDLSVIEVAGITTVMLITMFIDEVNPWITAVLGISGISWLAYRFFLSQKASRIADARELREKKEHENTLKIQRLQIKKLEKDIGENSDNGTDEGDE